MPRDGREQRVPAGLGVEVRVQVHEAGRHEMPLGVDFAAAGCRHLAHLGDGVAVDGHIADKRRAAGAVHHFAAANHQIMCHCLLPQSASIGGPHDSAAGANRYANAWYTSRWKSSW